MKKHHRRLAAKGMLLLGLLALVPGCEAFLTAAAPAIETGVTSIVNGLLDGIFASITPTP